MLKILASSDFHGNLPEITQEFDILFVCGDICPATNHSYYFQDNWLHTDFVNWVKNLPFKDGASKVIMTWGNHDFFGERCSQDQMKEIEMMTDNRLKILRHNLYEDVAHGITVFGTPYCSIFGNWAFMVSDETLDKKFSQIPEGIDFLISHDSPNINKLGAILEGRYKSDFTGNKVLAKHIDRIKPKVFLSGHFHSGNHNMENINDVNMANVSYVNEGYTPHYSLMEFHYDEFTKEICFSEK